MIKLMNICKSYGNNDSMVQALSNVNLEIKKGDFLAIKGKSGSGKSTLLNVMAGLTNVNDGIYEFNSNRVCLGNAKKTTDFRKKNIGYVVQSYALINDKTVYDNVSLPLRYNGLNKKLIKDRVMDVLEKLEIGDKAYKYPYELSGGQCQRVAIARAVVSNPNLILADEPTASLDTVTEKSAMEVLKNLNDNGHTIVMSTHDDLVASYADRIVCIDDGRILE